jgi:ascorbate-specific PTS system EIIC-type component UlaA
MATRQTSSQSLRSIAGAILLSLGFAILFVNLDAVESTVSDFAGISGHEGLGVLPALGLAGLHALQAYTFDQAGFGSTLLQILVSFWPLVLIFAGAMVLCRALRRRSAASGQVCQQPKTNDVRSH